LIAYIEERNGKRDEGRIGPISLPKRGVRWLQPPQRHFSERFVGIGIGDISGRYTREFFF
jgi:hypothetical protein